jgi:hypothetical protein
MTMKEHPVRGLLAVVVLVVASALAASCVVYEPVPAYSTPSTFDRAWSAALGALQDNGVDVTSADRGTGVIRGGKDGADVTVSVARQADGTTRVQFDAKQAERSPGLAERFSQSYERRMGR